MYVDIPVTMLDSNHNLVLVMPVVPVTPGCNRDGIETINKKGGVIR